MVGPNAKKIDTALLDDIKFNCDISDARFWGYFSICGLLMRYRDLFRSEQGLDPWDEIKREEITAWIQQKESRWPDLELQEFRGITAGARHYDPFDSEGINKALASAGILYGAGYGMYLKPTFFLAELKRSYTLEGHSVMVAGRELVRDLFSTPGMLRERQIVIRLEPLTALLWDRFQAARTRPSSLASIAFAGYGLPAETASPVAAAALLLTIAEQYADILVRHELAESLENRPEWQDILLSVPDRNVEHFVRAVKDLLADTSVHGPLRRIRETKDLPGLGLSTSLLDGYRGALFPELRTAYEHVSRTGDWTLLEEVRSGGYARFRGLRDEVIELFRAEQGEGAFDRKLRERIQELMRACEQKSCGTRTVNRPQE